MNEFKNGDRVCTRTGPGLGDQRITGRIVGQHNLSSTPDGPAFYIVLLDEKIDGFPWDAIVLHGSMLDKLTVLDDMAEGRQLNCPLCGGESG